jgi:hypothetical protein
MHSLNLSGGSVIRESDGKVIAPCQSADDPDFVAYIKWVTEGNQPAVKEETETA